MEVRDTLRNIQRTWVVLVPLFGQAMALTDNDLKAILGTIIPVAIILMVVATIFIIRYYKKLKEVQKTKKRRDAQEMMMMRDKFGHQSPHSAISSATGTRIPTIVVNGQHKPEPGKADSVWTSENGKVKRPTPALPGVVPQKPPPTGAAKKIGKKKGAKQPENATPTLPYPPFKQPLYAKNNSPALPFEEQVMSLDMVSEPGDVDDRGYDNDVFEDDDKPTSDREAFIMQRLSDELHLEDVNEASRKRSDSSNPHIKVDVEDFVGQVNEDDINAEVDPRKTIPSEVYYSERLYNSVERPKPEPGTLALPEAEVILELVEMTDFSSLVYAKDIEDAYARLEEESVTLSETQQHKVMQQVNTPPPPIPAKQGQPFLPPQIMPQPTPMYPTPAPVGLPMGGPPLPQPQVLEHRERTKSSKSSKSWKSDKSSKSNKSNKSNKSKKSNKMVPKRQVQKSDFAGQCHQDDIAKATGLATSPDHDVYAVVQKPKPPVVPPKQQPQVTQAEIPIPPKTAPDLRPPNPDEDEEELVIPDMGLFDLDEEAMRHHHVRLKKHAESHSPYLGRHDSGDSLSDDQRLSADAEVNAIFASIFRDHSRGGDTSEDELEKPRTPRTHDEPVRVPSPAPPLAAPVTRQEQLISEQLDKMDECNQKPEPVPSTSKIGPNVEPDRLRHDEARDVKSGESNPTDGSGGRDMDTDYEKNWGKLTDDTLPRQDY